jgi:hypothetical protein
MTIKGSFHVPIYECDVIITISDRIKNCLNYYLNQHDLQKHEYDFAGLVWRPDGISVYYVFFGTEDLDVNTYNHEKSHLVEWILKDRSISAQNEVRSYLDGFVSKKMNDFFSKRKIKLK